ncbi:5'-AMP-activated protein kinase beta subunit, interation domain-containing protein [Amylocystis lapponica]|nr:5'-AMP-activated protein kinase beta subunit, interation domain-containing protein [Amylocystis lapponica]
MGNTASNPANPSSSRSPVRRGSPARSSAASPSNRGVHRSLRYKKKSLELPDLASLALTPASSSPGGSVSPHPGYRRPRASSPIPIPISARPPQPTFRPQNNLPSAAHIDIRNHDGPTENHRPRYKSYLSSAYPSTRSLDSRGQGSPPDEDPHKPEFVPEVVHSTLPLALIKAEEDVSKLEPVSVKITWRGAGKSVVLARAGDNNWQGRRSMEFDSQLGIWFTYVSLLPGTHHLKFIVDDQWRIADDYPTAADDRDGSLANYVAVPFASSTSSPTIAPVPGSGSGSGPTSPLGSPYHGHPNQFNSFWSDASSGGGVNGLEDAVHAKAEPDWTTVIPPELVAAAAEEEVYLNSADSPAPSSHSSASGLGSVPAPNIPPAPVLPRHLDKLILNVRPAAVNNTTSSATDRDRGRKGGRERERSKRDKDSRARPSNLGMTSSTAEEGGGDGEHLLPSPLVLPVVTASGTDVTNGYTPPLASPALDAGSKAGVGVRLEVAGLADDASVLPVPSHVVLHHLSTSAIRNGVLAVANTTRYRKKAWHQYITTIYYKPT